MKFVVSLQKKDMKFGWILLVLIASVTVMSSCEKEEDVQLKKYISKGKVLYKQNCVVCHKEKGIGAKGLNGDPLYPPITNSDYFKENKSKIPCIIKHGISGEMKVNGETYNLPMPGVITLDNRDIAFLMTYLSNLPTTTGVFVSEEEVKEALKNCK